MVDRAALVIARYNLKNKVQRINATPVVWVGVVGLQVLLAGLVLSPDSSQGAAWLGDALARGEVGLVERRLTTMTLSLYSLTAVMAAFNWVTGTEDASSCEHGFLTMTTPDNVALGRLFESMAAFFVGFFPALFVGCLALGATAGRPVRGLGLALAAVFLYVTSQLVGAPVGMAGRWIVARSEDPDRVESIIGVAAITTVALTFAYSSQVGGALARTPLRQIATVPLSVLVPTAVSPWSAVLPTLVVVSVAAGSFLAVGRLAEPFYISDSKAVDGPTGESDADDSDGRVSTALVDPLLSERQATLVGVNWTRMVRSPEMLHRTGMYLLLGLAVGISSVAAGDGGRRLPVVLLLFGTIYAGQFVTLNALADEGPRMSLWGTTAVDGHDLFVSKAASTAAPTLLSFGAASVLAALLSGYGPLALGALSVLAVVGIVGSAVISTGIGFLWLEAGGTDPERDMAVPSLLASGIHFAVVTLCILPGIGSVLVIADALETAASTTALLGSVGSSVVVVAGVAAFLYVTSMRKTDERHYGPLL